MTNGRRKVPPQETEELTFRSFPVLQIRSIDGSTARIRWENRRITVAGLKQVIYEAAQSRNGEPPLLVASEPPYQRLIFRGRELRDSSALSHYCVVHNDVIHLVNRPDLPARQATAPAQAQAPVPPSTDNQNSRHAFMMHTLPPRGIDYTGFRQQQEVLERAVALAMRSVQVPPEAAARGARAGTAAALSSSAWPIRRTLGRYLMVQHLRQDVDALWNQQEPGPRQQELIDARERTNSEQSRQNLIAETRAIIRFVESELSSLVQPLQSVTDALEAPQHQNSTTADLSRIGVVTQALMSVRVSAALMLDWPEDESANPPGSHPDPSSGIPDTNNTSPPDGVNHSPPTFNNQTHQPGATDQALPHGIFSFNGGGFPLPAEVPEAIQRELPQIIQRELPQMMEGLLSAPDVPQVVQRELPQVIEGLLNMFVPQGQSQFPSQGTQPAGVAEPGQNPRTVSTAQEDQPQTSLAAQSARSTQASQAPHTPRVGRDPQAPVMDRTAPRELQPSEAAQAAQELRAQDNDNEHQHQPQPDSQSLPQTTAPETSEPVVDAPGGVAESDNASNRGAREAVEIMAREVQRSMAVSRGDIPGNPETDLPSLYDIVSSGTNAWEGTTDEPPLAEDLGFEHLLKLVTSDITIPESLALYHGHWECVTRIRPKVRSFFYQTVDASEDANMPLTREQLDLVVTKVFEEKACLVCRELDEELTVCERKKQHEPPYYIEEVVMKWLRPRMTELVSFWLNLEEVPDSDFPHRLKAWVDISFGELFHGLSEIMEGGLHDTRHVFDTLCGHDSDIIGREAMAVFSPALDHLFSLVSNSATRWKLRMQVRENPYPSHEVEGWVPPPETTRGTPAGESADYDALAIELAEEDEADQMALELAMEMAENEETELAEEDEADQMALELAMEMAEEEGANQEPQAETSVVSGAVRLLPQAGHDVFDAHLSAREAFRWRKRIAADMEKQNRTIAGPLSRGYRQGGRSVPAAPGELTATSASQMAVDSVRRICSTHRVPETDVQSLIDDITAGGVEGGRTIASEYQDEVVRNFQSRIARDPDFSASRFPHAMRRFG